MATLSIEDAAHILQSIALAPNEQATAAADELRSQITQLVLQRCDAGRRRDLLQRCAGLRLFRVFEAGDEKEHAARLRWEDLEARWKQGVLFKRQLTLRSGAFALRKMLPKEPITLMSEGLGDLLFGLNIVAVCDADACANLVLRQTDPDALAEAGRRNDLLDYFLKASVSGNVSMFRRAVAIVLHGRLPVPMSQPSLLVNAGASEPIWARITRDVLTQQDESWRLVDHGLSSRVPENRWSEFDLSAVDRDSVIHLLEEHVSRDGKDGVALNLSAGQREDLAGALYLANKLPLLKRLRIHAEFVNDRPHEHDPLHAITDRCYWHDTFALSPEIRPHVTLLRLSDNAALRDAQKQLAEVWNARAAVEVIFARLNPADHSQLVMRALVAGKDWPPQLIEQLQNTPWLARAEDDAAIRPCDIIFLESIRDTVSRVLAAATTKDFVDYQTLDDHARKAENLAFLGKTLFPANRPALENARRSIRRR
jgi:hypothetical protein